MLRERLGRGSITYILKMRTDSAEAAYHINTHALEGLSRAVAAGQGTGPAGAASTWPAWCSFPASARSRAMRPMRSPRHGSVIRELTAKAIDKLDAMRRREGEALLTELMKHSQLIAAQPGGDREARPAGGRGLSPAASQRVNQLLSKAELQVSQADLLKEVAVFAERADIAEEIQRLDQPPGGVRAMPAAPASMPAASSISSPRKCSARPTPSPARPTTPRSPGTLSRSRARSTG